MSRLTMTEQLDAVRDEVPGCTAVAFADISAGLVLSVSSGRRPPQEQLDALCEMAKDLLDGRVAMSARQAIGSGEAPIDSAVAMPAGRTFAFLRSARDPEEVLCCIGQPSMDIETLLAAGRAALAGIEAQS